MIGSQIFKYILKLCQHWENHTLYLKEIGLKSSIIWKTCKNLLRSKKHLSFILNSYIHSFCKTYTIYFYSMFFFTTEQNAISQPPTWTLFDKYLNDSLYMWAFKQVIRSIYKSKTPSVPRTWKKILLWDTKEKGMMVNRLPKIHHHVADCFKRYVML